MMLMIYVYKTIKRRDVLKKLLNFMIFNFSFSFPVYAECVNPDGKLVVLLKLDDLSSENGSRNYSGISNKWERVTKFLEVNGVAASFGVIGSSLESGNEKYFDWIKERQAIGTIEFWNHGYFDKFSSDPAAGVIGEFNGTSAEDQSRSIYLTQELAKKNTGIVLRGFGPHASAVDRNTFMQLDSYPEITYAWFYKPMDEKIHKQFIIQRVTELESPIFKPNFEAFFKTFSNRDKTLNYIAMQGHPNSWNEVDFNTFVRTVNWLRGQNIVFCRPSEFLKLAH